MQSEMTRRRLLGVGGRVRQGYTRSGWSRVARTRARRAAPTKAGGRCAWPGGARRSAPSAPARCSERNTLLDLDPYVGKALKLDDFSDEVLAGAQINGKTYAVTLGNNSPRRSCR